jgi:hypothetical protein
MNTNRWLGNEDPQEVSAFSWTHAKTRFGKVEKRIAFDPLENMKPSALGTHEKAQST